MKFLHLLIFLVLISILPDHSMAQQISDTSKVLVTFNEPMSREGIFDINNYSIFREDNTPVKIFKVGIAPGDSVIVLFTEKQSRSRSYKLIINNLRDKSGNIISESHKMVIY